MQGRPAREALRSADSPTRRLSATTPGRTVTTARRDAVGLAVLPPGRELSLSPRVRCGTSRVLIRGGAPARGASATCARPRRPGRVDAGEAADLAGDCARPGRGQSGLPPRRSRARRALRGSGAASRTYCETLIPCSSAARAICRIARSANRIVVACIRAREPGDGARSSGPDSPTSLAAVSGPKPGSLVAASDLRTLGDHDLERLDRLGELADPAQLVAGDPDAHRLLGSR